MSSLVTKLPAKIALMLTTLLLLSGCGLKNIPPFEEGLDAAWSEEPV